MKSFDQTHSGPRPASMKAMILAAGYGVRARPLSLVRPKPLFPVLGRPNIMHALDRLAAAGVRDVVVNAHYLADPLERFLADSRLPVSVRLIREEEILGTGGGLQNAREHLGSGPFFLVNADVYSDCDLKALAAAHFQSRPLATLAMHDYPRFNQVAVNPDGHVQSFRRRVEPDRAGRVLAFTGIQVIEPDIFEFLPAGRRDLIEAYQSAVDQGRRIAAYVPPVIKWWDIGSLDQYLDVHRGLLSERPEGPVLVHQEASVCESAEISGWSVVDRSAMIGPGARVMNSILWPGARVAEGVTVRDAVLADGAEALEDVTGQAVIRADD